MPQNFILSLFFFSGLSSLIYQVIWVRQFGNLFGNTVHSAAMVTSTFMLGLGIGSWLAGKLADRLYTRDRNAVLRVYGGIELALAVGASSLIVVFLSIDLIAAKLAWYELTESGWHELSRASYLLRYLAAVGLILPMTTLMGATLTLLIRLLVRSDTSESGKTVGRLYGYNTAGAALGCLLVDSFFIPSFGLISTQIIAVVTNVLIGLFALNRYSPDLVEQTQRLDSEPESSSRDWYFVAGALACTGFATLGLEIVWFRFLSSILGQTRIVFSILLGVILVGIWLGSLTAGRLVHRYRHAHLLFVGSQVVVCVLTVSCLIIVSPLFYRVSELAPYYSLSFSLQNVLLDVYVILRDVSFFIAIPAFALGFSFPLANGIVQDRESSVGRVAGRLYLWNTLGSVIGAPVCAFLLIPLVGIKASISLCLGFSLLACLLIYVHGQVSRGLSGRQRPLIWSVTPLALIAVLGWQFALPNDYLLMKSLKGSGFDRSQILSMSEGINEWIAIIQKEDGRSLYTDGHVMSQNTYRAQRYMRAFSHLPLMHLDAPTSAMIICFGVGNTVHAASIHPSIERIEVVDLSKNVLENASNFAATNKNVLEDPRLHVFVNDGRHHLRIGGQEKMDLITLEPPPINHAGVASLYSTEFYELAKGRLKPNGFVSQWLPIRQQPGHVVKSIIAAFIQVFPNAILMNGDYGEFILLGQKSESIKLTLADYTRRISERPEVAKDLENMGMLKPAAFFGTFAGDSRTLTDATLGVRPITDDLPAMEYTSPVIVSGQVPKEVFNFRAVHTWCSDCFVENGQAPGLRDELTRFLAIMEAMHQAEGFLNFNGFTATINNNIDLRMKLEVFQAMLGRHKYLDALF